MMSTTKQGLCLPSADVWIGFWINILEVFYSLNVLNRTNHTRLNSKHANTNQRTHPDGSGEDLWFITKMRVMRFQIIVHYSIFFYLILTMVALNNSRPWMTSDDRISMPLLEIAVQNQERRHCRSKTRFIGQQHVTESTLHNQSWAAKNRSLITDSAQNSLNSSLIAKKFDGCGLKNRVTSCAQDSLAQSALRRGAWWFALASRHQPLRRQNFKFTGFNWVCIQGQFLCQSVPPWVFFS